MRTTCLLLIVALCAACAHDVHVEYPAEYGQPTGMLVIKLASPASGVSVAIDGLLVVEDRHTDRIRVDSTPVGTREVSVTANGTDRQLHVWVGSGPPTTVLLGVPDAEVGLIKTVLGTILTLVVYSLLFH
jgi:hypothetical protein